MAAISHTTFQIIYLIQNVSISIKISLTFGPKGPINNITALVHIMAWHQAPMIVCLLTHICVTRPQWVNAYIGRYSTQIKNQPRVFHEARIQYCLGDTMVYGWVYTRIKRMIDLMIWRHYKGSVVMLTECSTLTGLFFTTSDAKQWRKFRHNDDIMTGLIDEIANRTTFRFWSLRPRQDGFHFPDDIFKRIFLNENVWILIKISLKFVPKGPSNNFPRIGSDNDNGLAPTRRQAIIWTNDGEFSDAYIRHPASMS